MNNFLYGSVCRISNLMKSAFTVKQIDRDRWDTGDYVVGEISSRPSHEARIEAPSGRIIEPLEGEPVVGAFGKRHATRGIVGDWRGIDPGDGEMNVIGGGGIIGDVSSVSPYLHDPIDLEYKGHVHIGGAKKSMSDYVGTLEGTDFDTPVILIAGTSMSSGKTMSARVVTRILDEMGIDCMACKLSGSGRYHDILAMKDAGAEQVFDFIDVGLPTTVVPPDTYQEKIKRLLDHIDYLSPDVAIIEIGASPLEPYNGDVAINQIRSNVQYTILTASDPYSVLGLTDAYDIEVNLVSGIATNTKAGIELIEDLSGITAVNLQEENEKGLLKEEIERHLNL